MARELVVRPEAEADLAEVFSWYEGREPGLGYEFFDEIDRRFESIRENPEQFEIVHKSYRRALVKRFPYLIFFRDEGERVVVHAVMHSARRPARWRRRLT
ncbi:MAG TPA: type II toxin-antitoxin system RelE/ParE family toxin [Planctomycetaceae bacterium]